MWQNITILRKYNIYIIDIGGQLDLTTDGLLGKGSRYENPSFIPTIYSLYLDDPRGMTYTIKTDIIKISDNIYKVGSIDNPNVKCKLKVLVYES